MYTKRYQRSFTSKSTSNEGNKNLEKRSEYFEYNISDEKFWLGASRFRETRDNLPRS